MPCSPRQPITTPYSSRPKISKVGLTNRQSVCLRPATSQLTCCLHGSGRCNYEARLSTGNDNCIVGIDNCNTAALTSYPSRRTSIGRSAGAQNSNRPTPPRLLSRNRGVKKSGWSTPSRISAVPSPSRPRPSARQDRPVDLYVGSRLPVPVRSGPVATRIPRIDRVGDVRLPFQSDGLNGSRCTTADRPHHNDDGLNNVHRCGTADMPNHTDGDLNGRRCAISDKPQVHDDMQHGTANGPHDTDDRQNDISYGFHNVVGSLVYNDTAVVPGQPSVMSIEELAASTSEQWCPPQTMDNRNLMGSQPVAIDSDSLSGTSNHPSMQQVSQNEPGNQCDSLFTNDILT